jgi:hypothetical protein
MKINNKLLLMTAVLLALGTTTACQPKMESENIMANKSVSQTADIVKQPGNTKMEIDKPAGLLSSPSEAYKTAHALRESKDLNGLKKVLSKKMLEFFAEMAKSENKTLDDQLKELIAQPQAATVESRNERIAGDLAALEYLDENGKWKLMGFVKEDGDWKITIPDAQISAIQNAPR